MTLTYDAIARPGVSSREFALWSGAAIVMLAVHAGAALYLTRNPPESIGDQAIAPPLLVELAPVLQSIAEPQEAEPIAEEAPPEMLEPEAEAPPPEAVETEVAEAVEPTEALEEPVTEEVIETPPEPLELAQAEPLEAEDAPPETPPIDPVEEIEPEPDVILPESDVPLPVARPRPQVVEREQPRPQRQRQRTERTEPREQPRTERPRRTAPPPAAASQPRVSRATTASWQRQVQARLNRFKRYPSGADGATGVARVRVSIDGSGRVAGASVSRSSGSAALDQAAVAMMQRAGRVPAPPDGAPKTLTVPVNFSERR